MNKTHVHGKIALFRKQLMDEFSRLSGHPVTSFKEWVTGIRPTYRWYAHCIQLSETMQRVAEGNQRYTMIFMPPRAGKSELVSRLFPAYYLCNHPQHFVGLCSYSASLADTLSRAAKDNFLLAGGRLRPDSCSVKYWQTDRGGGFWAAGVGGPATGKGFHLGIIDDPIKNAEEAASAAIREKMRDWYQSTFLTRQQPEGGSIVLVQTRWHEDDLAGWLLSRQDGSGWHIVNLPAIAETRTDFPAGCTVEPDWRQPGDPLIPETFPLERLKKIRLQVGERVWQALYQQRPTALQGGLFHRSWFTIVDVMPKTVRRIRYWDRAATADGGDWSVGLLMSLTVDSLFVIEDVVRMQVSTGERDRLIRQTAELDGKSTVIWTEQEPGSSGKDSALSFIRLLAGFAVHTETHRTDKVVRASPLASQAEAGNVRMLRGAWNGAFLEEVCMFPAGKHDDQVDAASGAFNRLCDPPERTAYMPQFAKAKQRRV